MREGWFFFWHSAAADFVYIIEEENLGALQRDSFSFFSLFHSARDFLILVRNAKGEEDKKKRNEAYPRLREVKGRVELTDSKS